MELHYIEPQININITIRSITNNIKEKENTMMKNEEKKTFFKWI